MKKLMKFLPAAAVIAVFVLASASCTKNYYETGLDIDAEYYYVAKNKFKWDDRLGRWYYSENDNWLTRYQVDDMEVAGTVVFGDDFCPMPYISSYYYGNAQVVEIVGYEVTYGKVTFYIQTNEKDVTWKNMVNEYEFKVSLFYWI